MHDYGQSLLRKTKLKLLIAERLGQSASNGIKAGRVTRKIFTLGGLQTFGPRCLSRRCHNVRVRSNFAAAACSQNLQRTLAQRFSSTIVPASATSGRPSWLKSPTATHGPPALYVWDTWNVPSPLLSSNSELFEFATSKSTLPSLLKSATPIAPARSPPVGWACGGWNVRSPLPRSTVKVVPPAEAMSTLPSPLKSPTATVAASGSKGKLRQNSLKVPSPWPMSSLNTPLEQFTILTQGWTTAKSCLPSPLK